MRTSIAILHQSLRILSAAVVVFATTTACAKNDVRASDTAATLASAPVDTSVKAPPAAVSPALTPVRGTIAAITDTALTVTTDAGPQQVRIVPPLRVYARTSSDLTHVTPKAFVGVTSVAQADGSERATEIHVFPEELRGTGEGSRMMAASGGSGTTKSAAPSRMTNGNVSDSRMTNGTVGTAGGGTYTVEYHGGSQKITVPADVAVTLIAASPTKLAVGTSVVVLGTKGADGKVSASAVMLTGATGGR